MKEALKKQGLACDLFHVFPPNTKMIRGSTRTFWHTRFAENHDKQNAWGQNVYTSRQQQPKTKRSMCQNKYYWL